MEKYLQESETSPDIVWTACGDSLRCFTTDAFAKNKEYVMRIRKTANEIKLKSSLRIAKH